MEDQTRNSKYKLQPRIILILIIILIIGICIYTKKLVDKTKEQNQAHVQELTLQLANRINSEFDFYFRELNYINKNIIKNDVLSEDTKKSLLEYKIYEKVFAEFLIVDKEGKGITSKEEKVDIGDTIFFNNVKNSNEPRVLESKYSEILDDNLVLFSMPTEENQIYRYIIGVTKSEIFTNKNLMRIYGGKENIYIINKYGKIIFAYDENVIGKDVYKILYNNSDNDENIWDFKKNLVNQSQGVVEETTSSEHFYLGFAQIPYTNDWYIVNAVPEEEIFENTENTVRILVVIILSILFIFIIIVFYFFIIQERLRKAAFKDKATDINNYEKFLLDARDFVVSKIKYKRVLLICFDIDKFKIINDIHGYETGDKVLKVIGQNLKNVFGNKAVYGRITGDIFALAVETEQDDKEIQRIVDIVRKDIINLKGHTELDYAFRIQGCVGVYIVQEEDSDIKKIVSNADMARIKLKENIYKPYVMFDQNMRAEIKLIARLEKDLYSAIENNELEVHYQPKYNIITGKIVGSEALIRWNHSELGLISPAKFIPIAEKNRFINKIGQWVFEEVCRSLRTCIDEGIEVVPIAINISRVELYQPNLIQKFEKVLDKYDIKPELIEIEITETTALNHIKFINAKLKEIKALGMKVAMDDFGTGNSNLSNLKEMPIDVLKLDRSLLKDIENNSRTEVMVKSIVSLSKNLRMITVCEGVENISQVEIIRNTGCEIIQGFVFSKPMKENMYKQLLEVDEFNL